MSKTEIKHRYKAILFFLSKHKTLYIAVFGVSLIVALLESFNIVAILPFLNLFLGDVSGGADQGYLSQFMTRVLYFIPFENKLLSACILLILATIIKALVKIFNEFLMAHASATVLYDTRKEIIERYSESPYRYFLDNKQGTLMYYVMSVPTRIANLLYRISQLGMELFKITAIMILLIAVNIYISLALIVLALVFNVLIGFMSRKVSYVLGQGELHASAEQSNVLNEFIRGIKHIKIYNAIKRWQHLFNKYSKQSSSLYVKNLVWQAVPTDVMEVSAIILLFGTALFLKLYSAQTALSYVPVMGIFGMALLKLLPSIRNTGRSRMVIWGMLPDAEVIYNLLNSNLSEPSSGGREFRGFNNLIQFEDVSFAYDNKNIILKNANFVFNKNRVNAIVGASGSGKTTIINLLLGLFRPDSGRILVDGVNLSEYKPQIWFDKIALVSQEPFIFHSTIADNISFRDQHYNLEDIKKAAKIANAHDFITEVPEGYQTIVGERGMKLSGGEQQRIAIARAIIRKPDILILDEATSALDSKSEKEIQKAMNNVSRLCTPIVIAHRLSTVRQADKIFVLKDGRIIEEGNHDELMANNGFYKELYEH